MPGIPKEEVKRLRYFAGLINAIEGDMDAPYLRLVKGRTILSRTTNINYAAVATKRKAASLLGDRLIEGQKTRRIGHDRFEVYPGMIHESETINATEAGLMTEDTVIDLTGAGDITTEEGIYRDKTMIIKNSIEVRKDIMVAQLVHNGEYVSKERLKIGFPIRAVDTLDYTTEGNFLVEYKKQLRAFIKANGRRPTDVIVGEAIVDQLLKDKVFHDEIYKLGLSGFNENDKDVVIARVLGTQLKEEAPAFDPDLEVDSAKANRLTLINGESLHHGYAAIDHVVNKIPKLIRTKYFAWDEVGKKSITYHGQSSYTPILGDPNGIWRVDVDLITTAPAAAPTPQSAPLSTDTEEQAIDAEVKELMDNNTVEELRSIAEDEGIEIPSSVTLKADIARIIVETRLAVG